MRVNELLRYWRQGQSRRRIAAALGCSRTTVDRYIVAARLIGLQPDGPEPDQDALDHLRSLNLAGPRDPTAPVRDRLNARASQIEHWISREKLTLTRIQELLADRGVTASYSSLRRWVRQRGLATAPRQTVRMAERSPGQVAEMDFARMGRIFDEERGRRRIVWTLQVVLPYSRHMFVWPTFGQKLADVVEGLERAWQFFAGMPRFLVIDNFPAAVAGADRYNPRLTDDFIAYVRHRGLLVDPTAPASPTQKPVVERSVSYTRQRFFAGSQFNGLEDMRSRARQWCLQVAGQRVHGTTRRRPLDVFTEEELPHLRQWDWPRYEIAKSRTVKVQPDYHVTCEYALYSVPHGVLSPGANVRVEYDAHLVRVFSQGVLVKVHRRLERGERSTDPEDLPKHLQEYVKRDPESISMQAWELDPRVGEYADSLLGDEPGSGRLRAGYRLLRMGQRYGAAALSDACRIASAAELFDVKRLEAILDKGLERRSCEEPLPPPPGAYLLPGGAFAVDPDGGNGNGGRR